MTPLEHIEILTRAYAVSSNSLKDKIQALQDELDAVEKKHRQPMLFAGANLAGCYKQLESAIDAARDTFEKPRTQVFSNVKVGLAKQKGKTIVDDEARTINLIRVKLPKDQAELLISVKESVFKPGVADLTAADLKRLGIRIEDDTDRVVIKLMDAAVEKAIKAIVKEIQETEDPISEVAS